MTRTTLFAIPLLLVPLFSGCECECKAGDVKPISTTGTPAATETPAPAAPVKEGLVLCTRYENKACADPSTQFSLDMLEIHAVLVTRVVPKSPKASMVWIAEETGGAAPPNYKIATKELELPATDLAKAGHITINGSLSRPTKGWPAGKYRLEVYLDGKVAASQQFAIK